MIIAVQQRFNTHATASACTCTTVVISHIVNEGGLGKQAILLNARQDKTRRDENQERKKERKVD